MSWSPLSARTGKRAPSGPYEGLPDHLKHGVGEWIKTAFGWNRPQDRGGMDDRLMATVATTLRLPVRATYELGGISDQIFAYLDQDEDLYLDCLDLLLQLKAANSHALKQLLDLGGSAWTVATDQQSLTRRVSEGAQEQYQDAISAGDTVAMEIKAAWAALFSRNPDPSDGWDHAIKAVEELLIPIVIPNKSKPNLGGVAGELKATSSKWKLPLATNSSDLDDGRTLEALLRLIWPNPDRHGGATSRRAPTQVEAEAALHVAITVVELCRSGRLQRHS